MLKKTISFLFLFISSVSFAQKKPLNHTVYDNWESIGAKHLSNNGIWAAYTLLKQEGDGTLHLNNLLTNVGLNVARGTNLQFSTDSKYAALMVKPLFKDLRQSKIKKKKPEEITKDSLFIINLNTSSITRMPRI